MSILEDRQVDFEFDGEMQADVALNRDLMEKYPFMRLSGPANLLIMPTLHSANISYKLLSELGGGRIIGPMLLGMSHAIQVARLTSTATDLVNMAALAAANADMLEQTRGKVTAQAELEL